MTQIMTFVNLAVTSTGITVTGKTPTGDPVDLVFEFDTSVRPSTLATIAARFATRAAADAAVVERRAY
jgi:hypothetical protein